MCHKPSVWYTSLSRADARGLVCASLFMVAISAICSLVLGTFSLPSFISIEVAIATVLFASYGVQERYPIARHNPSALAYFIVGILATSVVALIGFASYYAPHHTGNGLPLLACLFALVLLKCVRKVVRLAGLTILHDCVDLLVGRQPKAD
jgi:hypothetical protein